MLLGAHVSTSGGIDKAIDRVESIGGDAVQVFTQSPRAWRPTNHKPEAVERFRERRAEAGVGSVVCHATYLINLGATDDVIYHKSVNALKETMESALAIGSEGVVFHRGSHLGRGFEQALHQVIPALQVVLGERDRHELDPWLLIENAAGHEGTMGVSLEELQTVIDELDRPDCVGVCLDTCHLFASGYDIPTPDEMDLPLEQGGGRTRWTRCSTRRTTGSASTGCARCTSTTRTCRSTRAATATRTSARARSA